MAKKLKINENTDVKGLKGWQALFVADALYLLGILFGTKSLEGSLFETVGFIALVIGIVRGIYNLVKKRTRNLGFDIVMTVVASILVIVLLAVVGNSSSHSSQSPSNSNSSSVTEDKLGETLQAQATSLRNKLPKKSNDSVTITTINVVGHKVIYGLVFTSEVDPSQLNDATLKTPALATICKSVDTLSLLNAGATFEYDYFNPSSTDYAYRVSISRSDC